MYGHLEKKSRDVLHDLRYLINSIGDIIFHMKDTDKKLEHEGKFLSEIIKKYANGIYIYKHSKYFNPIIIRDLQKEVHDKLKKGATIEELVELVELCKKIKKEYSER